MGYQEFKSICGTEEDSKMKGCVSSAVLCVNVCLIFVKELECGRVVAQAGPAHESSKEDSVLVIRVTAGGGGTLRTCTLCACWFRPKYETDVVDAGHARMHMLKNQHKSVCFYVNKVKYKMAAGLVWILTSS